MYMCAALFVCVSYAIAIWFIHLMKSHFYLPDMDDTLPERIKSDIYVSNTSYNYTVSIHVPHLSLSLSISPPLKRARTSWYVLSLDICSFLLMGEIRTNTSIRTFYFIYSPRWALFANVFISSSTFMNNVHTNGMKYCIITSDASNVYWWIGFAKPRRTMNMPLNAHSGSGGSSSSSAPNAFNKF